MRDSFENLLEWHQDDLEVKINDKHDDEHNDKCNDYHNDENDDHIDKV